MRCPHRLFNIFRIMVGAQNDDEILLAPCNKQLPLVHKAQVTGGEVFGVTCITLSLIHI